ncbi:Polypeptide N-acetylgalactosaminyltransferase, partial [Caligus rogercresseyi]
VTMHYFSRKALKIYSQSRGRKARVLLPLASVFLTGILFLKATSNGHQGYTHPEESGGSAMAERLFRREPEETATPRKTGEFDVVGSLPGLPSFKLEEPGYVHKVELSGEEAALAEEIIQKEAFNRIASDKISVHRSVPDTRDPECRSLVYDSSLPSASVIIIFTNEAWTPLLRTIWSVLNRTPEKYLHEIILVDDASDRGYWGMSLLKRLGSRQGLIRARLEGAKLASGDVILFLDSHCECGQQWLEPLLQRIKENPKTFVVPVIDVIDDKTMEYYHSNGNYFQIGGFTWSGHFNWVDVPENDPVQRNKTLPTRTPTMAGGLFAVDREYFWESGSYDSAMDVWGGENLEMSFRIWQCGGILETIPCSRVGHIFRSFHPYSFPGNKDTHGINTARTFEVWMDDYKRLFYLNRPDLKNAEIGDISERLRFRREKGCKPFKWFLDTVYPQKFIPDDPNNVRGYGRFINPGSGSCIDTLQNEEKEEYTLGFYPCHDFSSASQFFSYSLEGEIRGEESCATVNSETLEASSQVIMSPCNGNPSQKWDYLGNRFTGKEHLRISPCKILTSQIWDLEKDFEEP